MAEEKKKHNDKCKCEEHCDCKSDCNCEENNGEVLDLISTLQRLQAEFDNYRKRTTDAEKKAFENGYYEATKNILPIMDTFLNAEKLEKDENIKKVISTLSKQVQEILLGMKVEKINAVGNIFDPELHSAVLVEKAPGKKEEEILEEFQEGYILNGRVLRHSVVKINKM